MFEIINTNDIKNLITYLKEDLNLKENKYLEKEIITNNFKEKRTIGIITNGKATMIKTDINGNETILKRLKTFDVISNLFFYNSNDNIVIQSSMETSIIFIDYVSLINNQSINNKVITNLFNLLIRECNQENIKIELLSQRTIRDKFLFFLKSRLNDNNIFTQTTPYREIAMYLCVDRSNLMREIKKLEKEGIIKKDGKTIHLLIN